MRKYILALVISILLTGCAADDRTGQEVSQAADTVELESKEEILSRLDRKLNEVREQSDKIKEYLENEAVTQTDMNEKSLALYMLWDDAMNDLLEEFKKILPEDQFEKTEKEQLLWISEREKAAEEAAKEFAGGSIYPLILNGEYAQLTEDRVYELFEMLLQLNINASAYGQEEK